MRLTRLYVEAELAAGSIVDLPAQAASHLAKVLRAREGDELILFNGTGTEFTAIVQRMRGSRVAAQIGADREVQSESPLSITLLQSVSRGDRMDFIVQKATELGVSRIVPVMTQRSVVRLDAQQAQAKQSHWRAVAVSACEQSGRGRLPQIEEPRQLLHHLAEQPRPAVTEVRWVFQPGHRLAPDGCRNDATPPIRHAQLGVGPEGGFTAEELEAFRVAGFSQAGLGPRILRTETAALAAVALMQARHGDMGPNIGESSP